MGIRVIAGGAPEGSTGLAPSRTAIICAVQKVGETSLANTSLKVERIHLKEYVEARVTYIPWNRADSLTLAWAPRTGLRSQEDVKQERKHSSVRKRLGLIIDNTKRCNRD